GSEIEVYDEYCHGPIHVLCFMPSLENMEQFTRWLAKRMKNVTLSSQRYYGTAKELQYKVKELEGIFIPAHIFTPFKSLYGKGVRRSLEEVDRKSTRLNSSHVKISYAVFCLQKKKYKR